MFQTVPLSIISSFSLYTQQAVWHTPVLCVQWKTPHGGDDLSDRNCPKHVQFYSKNKFEKLMYLVGFIIRIYHNARSPRVKLFPPHTVCWPTVIFLLGSVPCHMHIYVYTYMCAYIYTGYPRRNVPDFRRVFLRSNYTDITQKPISKVERLRR